VNLEQAPQAGERAPQSSTGRERRRAGSARRSLGAAVERADGARTRAWLPELAGAVHAAQASVESFVVAAVLRGRPLPLSRGSEPGVSETAPGARRPTDRLERSCARARLSASGTRYAPARRRVHAVLRGREDLTGTLAKLGAGTTVPPADAAIAAVVRGERATLPAGSDPDAQEVLILAALGGQLEAVVQAAGVNFFGVVGGGPRGTLLHHACWVGDPRVVERLLELGADPVARSGAEFDTLAGLGRPRLGLVAYAAARLRSRGRVAGRRRRGARAPLCRGRGGSAGRLARGSRNGAKITATSGGSIRPHASPSASARGD
jgi:hypothetical protein